MKKTILFLFTLLALATQTQAQCVTKTFYNISVTVCNDGDIPSFAITPVEGGYKVTYDPAGVDFTSVGVESAYINDLDRNLCATCKDRVSFYGYCGSTQGVAMISYTCVASPWSYNLWVDPASGRTSVNLQLVLYYGKTPDGALHYRYHNFTVAYSPPAAAPAVITTTTTTTTTKKK